MRATKQSKLYTSYSPPVGRRPQYRQSSYADIFFNNCFKNGLLPIRLDAAIVDTLFKAEAKVTGFHLRVDLEQQTITTPDGAVYPFEVEAFRKHCLLNGLDDIGLTMQHVDEIKAYEQRRKVDAPWLFS